MSVSGNRVDIYTDKKNFQIHLAMYNRYKVRDILVGGRPERSDISYLF